MFPSPTHASSSLLPALLCAWCYALTAAPGTRGATKLRTPPPHVLLSSEQIGPQASRLKLCLYQVDRSSQGHQLLAQGSFHLDSLFSEDEPESLEHVRIPLVNHVGKAAAELECSMRFFHARTPGGRQEDLKVLPK